MIIRESFLTRNPCYTANVNQQDSRYTTFQKRGPIELMLHSVGCNQPSAEVFVNGWNKESYDRACVHAFIDANTGEVWQTLPWNYRGWHCGGSGNNTHVGVEMCESKYINYINGYQFTVSDKAKAQADAKRAYDSAVELFAMLCKKYQLDPLTSICSHKEGAAKGIASDHGDPEHYWQGLGIGYTMNGFRNAVKAAIAAAENPFTDVKPNRWYTDAAIWCWENGIVSGRTPTYLGVNENVTKGEVMVMLKKLYELINGGG